MLDHQLQHHLVQLGPMIPALAPGNVNDLRIGLLVTVIAPVDMESVAFEIVKRGARPKRSAAVAAMRL